MRFLVISDIHLHLWNYGDTNERLRRDIEDVTSALGYGIDNSVDAVLFCGDIFHTHGNVSTIVLSSLFDSLKKFKHWMSDKTIFIPGNHDLVYKSMSSVNSICFLEHFGRVSHHQTTWSIGNNFPLIHTLPYTENEAELNGFIEHVSDNSIVLMHQGVSGVEVNSKGFTLNELLKPSLVPNNIAHAFTGHYHSKKAVSNKLTIPGALVQHNFGDAGEERGFLDVTIDSDGPEILFVESKHHIRFYKKKFTDSLLGELEHGDYFLCIEDVPINRLNDLKMTLDKKDIKAKIITKKIEDVEFQRAEASIRNLDTMFETYIKAASLSEELCKVGRDLINEASKTSTI